MPYYYYAQTQSTDVDVMCDLCKSIAADIAAVHNNCSNNIIIFVKCIIFGENFDEPEYVKSTMTNRPYPHVIKRLLSAFNVFFFLPENQKLEREKKKTKK